MTTQIERLSANLAHVPARNLEFAQSLIYHHTKKGTLTDKQWYWVDKLATDAEQAALPLFSPTPKTEAVGDLAGLLSLFKTAGKKLKYPAITLNLPNGDPIRLYVAGAKSKTPGHVQITNAGKWGSSMWYGHVSPDGVLTPSKALQVDKKLGRALSNLLKQLSADPAGTAAAYGKMTGCCCFCGKGLTDDKSLHVGYGPTCAANYHLPWGKKA